MTADDIRLLIAYDEWANRRLLDAAVRLTPEAFSRELGASFGSISRTLIHIMWGEKRWLQFWLDGALLPDSPPTEFPNVASIVAAWSSLESERNTFAKNLSDERLRTTVMVRGEQYTLAELMQHVLNHSTYHRGQVALLLRQLGQAPPATDYRVFLTETRRAAS